MDFWIHIIGVVSLLVILGLGFFEKGWGIFIAIAVAFISFDYTHEIMYSTSVKDNIYFLLISLPIYFLFGFLWSLVKWYRFVKHKKEKDDYKPSVSGESDRIGYWIVYWPISVLCYCLEYLFVDVTRKIIKYTEDIFNRITDKIYGK